MKSEAIDVLDQAIKNNPSRPKGIKVAGELWKALNKSGRVKWKRGYFEGIMNSGKDFPVLDEDIFIHVDPELDNWSYDLPKSF
jgi:hypothetical protein